MPVIDSLKYTGNRILNPIKNALGLMETVTLGEVEIQAVDSLSNVNVFHSNWRNTGEKVQIDKWVADCRMEWIDRGGKKRSWKGVITYPNNLAQVPTDWQKEELLNFTMKAERKRLSIAEKEKKND